MRKGKRNNKSKNVVRTVSKKKKLNKPKRKYMRKSMFKCISKNYSPREFVREVENIHGAKDDVKEIVEVLTLQFSFSDQHTRRADTPRILHADYTFCTSDVAIGNSYVVGQEYKDLPK